MRRALWLAWLLLAAVLPCQAGSVAIGTEPVYALSRAFAALEDPGGMLTVDEVRQPALQARFQPVPASGPGPNFGLSRSAWWLMVRLDAQPQAPREWLLEIAYPPLDRVEVYVPGPGGVARQVGGDTEPFADRTMPHRNHVFKVDVQPGGPTVLYLRIASAGTLSAPARLWQPAALWQHDQATYAGLSLYFGLLGGLLLYNLLLFVSVRDRSYLVYVAFVAAMGVGQAALLGLGAQFLWPGQTWWNTVSVPVAFTATALFGLQFARSFLSSAARMPRLDRLVLAQMAGWAVALVASLALPYRSSAYLVIGLSLAGVVTVFVLGYLGTRGGFAGARAFFLAWALLLLGVAILLLHNVGLLPSNAVTANSLLIGSALEMVLLSFALGDRINVARRFKEQAQARIAAEHAMVEALSQSQARLQQVLDEREVILENSIVGIAFLTPEGRFRWANKAMADIFGGGFEPITSMEPFYLSREDYLQVGREVAAAVARGEVYERELLVRRRDGALIWVALSGKAVSRRDLGQGTVWVVMDITERKRLQEQLQSTMSEREAILNNAVVGIVLSVFRIHEWVNEKFAQMLGYPRQVLIGQSSLYIHADRESWERFGVEARASLIATNGYTCERQLRRRTGELIWVQMGGSCVRANDPDSGVIWTFLDITERKKGEAEILEALEQQRALNDLRTRFVAMTSHEFRTPLAAILSAEEVLRHYGDRLPATDRLETLDGIAAGVQRMSRMLDRVLLLGQADAQMLEFRPADVNLPALCRRLVEEVWAQHPDTDCEIAVRAAPAVGTCRCDEKLLRHIFGNLLFNAIKYSPDGGQVRFDVRREGAELVFEVADQGIGIPPDEVGHLFGSFHRASNVGSIQGTGLGLAIVKNAVQVHGGRIDVESTLGKGSTFTVRLPMVPAGAPA
ncbi:MULTISPECIES: 7TM diverse intracellular signaling domain-containing protein [Ramlibacter]|uniref:histidine kinase n=1 Tax=Ramlibacter pinisoli TaxID=2682844 RepID=A0A6N8IXB0_9BURK|nr:MULTISPECIES: 7TM diverse intracellular signaling domain-containing protein [Ramlibacter]MBA2961338.1 PAS domain S-box protein [Ramlibacter sp. CGMCC 1.13660]MVQ31282.1 PAS domain S-box protein [Ramlibacter pinisoli]